GGSHRPDLARDPLALRPSGTFRACQSRVPRRTHQLGSFRGGRRRHGSFLLWSGAGRSARGPPWDGQPSSQVVEDSPDASLVKTRASGDFCKRKTLPLQAQNLAVSRRAFLQHKLPKLVTLSDLARPRLTGVGQLVGVDLVQRAFLLQGSVMLASAINESVASYLHQKGSKVSGIGVSPSFNRSISSSRWSMLMSDSWTSFLAVLGSQGVLRCREYSAFPWPSSHRFWISVACVRLPQPPPC